MQTRIERLKNGINWAAETIALHTNIDMNIQAVIFGCAFLAICLIRGSDAQCGNTCTDAQCELEVNFDQPGCIAKTTTTITTPRTTTVAPTTTAPVATTTPSSSASTTVYRLRRLLRLIRGRYNRLRRAYIKLLRRFNRAIERLRLRQRETQKVPQLVIKPGKY